jgi:hypothetical protein
LSILFLKVNNLIVRHFPGHTATGGVDGQLRR